MRPASSLPGDGHVHTEWSWDAPGGDMERSCERAVQLGLPSLAFTEHVDGTTWTLQPGELDAHPHLRSLQVGLTLPAQPFDVDGYLASVERCRHLFPQLRILTGAELGEPHRHTALAAALLAGGRIDRVLGSLHCLPLGPDAADGFGEPAALMRSRPAAEVMRTYLAEVSRLIEGSDAFAVLAHIDYVSRSWPGEAGPFVVDDFEDEFRAALRSLAGTGRALEVNTATELRPQLVAWWRDCGGRALTFGSDAHDPDELARGLRPAAAMAEAHGFRPARDPVDPWLL